MKLKTAATLGIFLIYLKISSCHIPDELYNLMPPIYKMDNYTQCIRNDDIYCESSIRLKPFDANSELWKVIELTKQDMLVYDHDLIHRTTCIPKTYRNNPEGIKKYISNLVNKEVEVVNLTATVEITTCKKDYVPSLRDTVITLVICSYLGLVALATLYDCAIRICTTCVLKGHKYIIALSMISNWESTTKKLPANEDYNNLKSVQGIRVCFSIFVVMCHSQLSYVGSFIENTEFVEKAYYSRFYIYSIFGYLVLQIYFLISSWMLALQVYRKYEKDKEFSIGDAFEVFWRRYFRFLPTVAFAVALQIIMAHSIDQPVFAASSVLTGACENVWWGSLLFINNNFQVKDICLPHLWSLATEMQLSLVGLIMLYLIVKLKSPKMILGFSFVLAYALFGISIYLHNEDTIFRPVPENFKWTSIIYSNNCQKMYFSNLVNWPSYIVGICFATIYYRFKNDKAAFTGKCFRNSWIVVVAVSVIATMLSEPKYSRLSGAIIGPLAKPLLAFGSGIAILSFTKNTGGIFKKALEWRPLEFLSQFTFCTYIFHLGIIGMNRAPDQYTPFHLSEYQFFISILKDVITSFIVGIMMHLIIELPANNLINMLTKTKRSKDSKKK